MQNFVKPSSHYSPLEHEEGQDTAPLLSWDSEELIALLEENPSNVSPASIASFFDRLDPTENVNREDQGRCATCLDLDYAEYEDDGTDTTRSHLARLFELRMSGRNGCEACLMIFNALTHFCRADIQDWATYAVEMVLGTVFIYLRPESQLLVALHDYDHSYRDPFVIVELFAEKVHPLWPSIGRSADVPVSLDLQHCLSVVKPLLETCVRLHEGSCREANLIGLPARLLDLGTIEEPHVKLVLVEDISQKDNLKYAALSHCWGVNGVLVRTTILNIDQHRQVIAWNELSKTFQDAILVTRGLGIQYLWIDSLCIIQDSASDWAAESKRMGTIYSNAHLTISATGSADGSGGCLFPRWVKGPGVARRVRETVPIHAGTYNGQDFKVNARLTFDAAHQQFGSNGENLARLMAPLMSRAWCFQERMMSRRVLHFHSEEVVWECATTTACECGFLKGLDGLYRASFGETPYRLQASQVFQGTRAKDQAFNTWRGLIGQYSGLLITRETDRLPALAGLAGRFQSVLNCQYLAALWADDLLRGLLWRRPLVGYRRRRKAESTGSQLPTWSWASIEHINLHEEDGTSGAYYPPALDAGLNSETEILAISTPAGSEVSTMAGSGISISLRGPCVFVAPPEYDFKNGVEVQYDVEDEKPEVEVACFLVGVIKGEHQHGFLYFLILSPLKTPGKFRRIGSGHLDPERAENWFRDALWVEVELV
ncbi:hypothetical protein OQA88_7106 [Cercophora sp. LCS_1]